MINWVANLAVIVVTVRTGVHAFCEIWIAHGAMVVKLLVNGVHVETTMGWHRSHILLIMMPHLVQSRRGSLVCSFFVSANAVFPTWSEYDKKGNLVPISCALLLSENGARHCRMYQIATNLDYRPGVASGQCCDEWLKETSSVLSSGSCS